MELASISLLINCLAEDRKGRITSFAAQGRYGSGQTMVRHESSKVALRVLRPASSAVSRPWDDVDIEAARAAGGVTLALGEFDKAPTSGTWPLAFDGDDTGLEDLPEDISAEDLKTVLEFNPAIDAEGGIASVVQTGRTYRVTFEDPGEKPNFTSGENTLLPLSNVTIVKEQVGTATKREIVAITVKRDAYAKCTTWTAAPAAAVGVETAVVGDTDPATNCVQVITLTPGAYGGTYKVRLELPDVVTGPGSGTTVADIVLAATDTVDQVLTKLLQHREAVNGDGTNNLNVTGETAGPFTVEFIGELKARPIVEMTATNINLLVPKTIEGNLTINVPSMAQFFDSLGTVSTGTLTAELTIQEPGGDPAKPYQDTWTVKKSVLNGPGTFSAPPSTYPMPGVLVQFRPDIDSFADLAAVPTAGGGVRCVITDIPAPAAKMYGLFPGTDATDTAAGIQRPGDFDLSTNPYVWKAI